jgi:hypothetical protein
MATAYVNQTPIPEQIYTLNGYNVVPFICDVSKLASSFAGFVINDTLLLADIPNLCMFVDLYLDMPSVDSNVSPAAVESLGDNAADATHGALGVGGIATGMTLGRGSSGTFRAGGTGFVHGALPFIYSIPFASLPTTNILKAGPLGAVSLMLKFTTAPATGVATGKIYGWVAYTLMADLTMPSGSGGVQPL